MRKLLYLMIFLATPASARNLAGAGGILQPDRQMIALVDIDNIKQVGAYRRIWFYLAARDKADDLRNISLVEADCDQDRIRTLADRFYGPNRTFLSESKGLPTTWSFPTPGTTMGSVLDIACGRRTFTADQAIGDVDPFDAFDRFFTGAKKQFPTLQ